MPSRAITNAMRVTNPEDLYSLIKNLAAKRQSLLVNVTG
jgi:hypothetical protein